MTITELRIGNYYLNDKGEAVRWEKWMYDSTHEFEEIDPVPLTEEWLVKCGFEKDDDGCLVKDNCMYWLKDGRLQLAFGYAPLINAPCKYVHQLQNLYFALTGEELVCK